MERRFAVHAQALIGRGARRRAWLIVLAVLSVAGAAEAKPKRHDAKVWFDRGLAAYKKNSFEAASEAFGKSFEFERDVDTLFAWAQSERKLEHCDKAIELYEKLLTFNLPVENKEAVDAKLTECRTQLGQGDHKSEPAPGTSTEPVPGKSPPVVSNAELTPSPPRTDHASPASEARPGDRAWYKNPVSLVLLGTGVVATGVGAGFLVSAKSLDNDISDRSKSPTYAAAQKTADKAKLYGNIGLVTAGVGGALVIGGVVWIVTHRGSTEQRTMTGWLAPGGGGLALAGSF